MADITTKAGLALSLRHTYCDPMSDTDADIAAIEAEAVRAERARLAKAVRELTTYDDPGVPECDLMLYRDDVLALLEGEG